MVKLYPQPTHPRPMQWLPMQPIVHCNNMQNGQTISTADPSTTDAVATNATYSALQQQAEWSNYIHSRPIHDRCSGYQCNLYIVHCNNKQNGQTISTADPSTTDAVATNATYSALQQQAEWSNYPQPTHPRPMQWLPMQPIVHCNNK